MGNGIVATKIIFIVLLFSIFIIFFGIGQIQSYLKKGVVVEVSHVSYLDSVHGPKLTICPLDPMTEIGWQDYNFNFCNGKDNFKECILGSTYEMKDFTWTKEKFRNSSVFFNYTEEITAFSYGNCLTIDGALGTLNSKIKKENELVIPLKTNLLYAIFIYDPKFFYISEHPRAVPGLRIDLGSEIQNKHKRFVKIEIIEHEMLNLANQPCDEDETYRFADCLRDQFESAAQCRLPWHEQMYGKGDVKTCDTMEEFEMMTMKNGYNSFINSELNEVVQESGCRRPCRYREIRAAGTPRDIPESGSGFMFFVPKLVSTDILRRTEKLSIPFSTLIGNIGGTLGLFLGFSFMMFWDWIEFVYRYSFSRG